MFSSPDGATVLPICLFSVRSSQSCLPSSISEGNLLGNLSAASLTGSPGRQRSRSRPDILSSTNGNATCAVSLSLSPLSLLSLSLSSPLSLCCFSIFLSLSLLTLLTQDGLSLSLSPPLSLSLPVISLFFCLSVGVGSDVLNQWHLLSHLSRFLSFCLVGGCVR